MSERERLERIRTITKYFPYWQGLITLPFGILLLVLAFILSFQPLVNLVAWYVIVLALLTAAILASFFISAGYRQLFGTVRNGALNRRLWIQSGAFQLLILAALAIDIRFHLPIFFTALAYAAFFAWVRSGTGGGRIYYLWLAVALALASLLPLVTPVFHLVYQSLLVIIGLGMVLGSILDHLELTRVFKPVAKEGGAS